jgi:spore maturation protein CgeB
MTGPLKIRYFAHSWVSDWNHGNAHFLRGLARALQQIGNEVRCYEQLGSWSLQNLMHSEGERAIEAIDRFRATYPDLDVRFYNLDDWLPAFLREELADADLVILHEWNEPELVSAVLRLKNELGFRALFHDTHHRAYTSPGQILRFPLHLCDGVLAFGEAIRRIYINGLGVTRAWTFHEAADTTVFRPRDSAKQMDVVWIGNWGDEERTRELEEFLIAPTAAMHDCHVVVHGVRYPVQAKARLAQAGIEYRGYLPNLQTPEIYAQTRIALHVPRRQYSNGLSGIPTIRVFEALACGAPLVCSPWSDVEELFRPGIDYACVHDGAAMRAAVDELLHDDSARQQMAQAGLETIQARHTCQHRALQLMEICEELER